MNPYVVHFCPGFFNLAVEGPWTSRSSVIVHEVSHFFDGHADGRHDYVYGKGPAEELAATERWKAARNADNFEYFVMDTTPYDD